MILHFHLPPSWSTICLKLQLLPHQIKHISISRSRVTIPDEQWEKYGKKLSSKEMYSLIKIER